MFGKYRIIKQGCIRLGPILRVLDEPLVGNEQVHIDISHLFTVDYPGLVGTGDKQHKRCQIGYSNYSLESAHHLS